MDTMFNKTFYRFFFGFLTVITVTLFFVFLVGNLKDTF